jgi:hypothetical protein
MTSAAINRETSGSRKAKGQNMIFSKTVNIFHEVGVVHADEQWFFEEGGA